MKIVFVTSTLGYGGAAKMLSFVANNIQNTDNEVHVIGYSCNESIAIFDKNVHLHLLGSSLKDSGHIKKIMTLYKKIKDIAPDLIVSFLTFPNMYSVLVGNMLRIPVIISERGNPYVAIGKKMKIIYSIINWANGAVFQTEGAKSFFSKRLQKKSVVIPNPVVKRNNNVSYNIDCNNHEIVFVGRLENKQKRLDVLFDALKFVLGDYPDAKLLIYGSGEDEQMLKEMSSRLDYGESIKFMGSTSDPENAMAQSEVYVISSDYEGIPNSLIEAMSIGMPVIATDCDPGGARLLIQDGSNGFLVPKGDFVAISSKIKEIFTNNNLKKAFSNNAKSICETYSIEKVKNKWKDYILQFRS